MGGTTFTRDELHDLVWSIPVCKLAQRFGISDVGLAKICDRHEIPRPPRGYWAKQEAGKRVSRSALPPLGLHQKDLRTITIAHRARRPAGSFVARGPQPIAVEGSEAPLGGGADPVVPELEIAVSNELRNPHPLLRPRTRGPGSKKKPGKTLRKALQESFCRKCYGRALRSLDALFKYLEENVYAVEVSNWTSPPQFVVTIEEQRVVFQIREEKREVRRKKRLLPDERRWWREGYEYQTIERCTGRLVFEATAGWSRGSFIWKETDKRKKLEAHLGVCVSGLLKKAEESREAFRRQEEAWQRRKLEEEERQKREEEASRLQRIEDMASNWDRAERLRAFVTAARSRAGNGGEAEEGWMAEALAQADRIDPLLGPDRNQPRGE